MEYELEHSPDNVNNNFENLYIQNKQSKFKKFFSLFWLFNNTSLKITKEKSLPTPFEQQAGIFLTSGNYEAYIKMLNEGYIPTQNQAKIVDRRIHDLFFNRIHPDDGYRYDLHNDLIALENLLSIGYQLKQKDVILFFMKINDTILVDNEKFFTANKNLKLYTMDESHEYPHLSEQIRNIIKTKDFSEKLSNAFKLTLENKTVNFSENFMPFSFILKTAPELLLKNITLPDFLELNNKFIKRTATNDQQDIMNNIINQYYSNEMKPFYMNIKEKYTTDFLESMMVNKVKKDIDTLKEIPKQALDIIQSIEMTFNSIQKKSINNINMEQLQLMLDKRIPEVLSKYLTIDPDYRTSLKNIEGKNAQELMIESLNNIASLFHNMYQEINQESVNSLSATTRYTKALKH